MFSLAYLCAYAYAYVLVKTSLDWAHDRRPRANDAGAIEEIVTQVTNTLKKKDHAIHSESDFPLAGLCAV